MENLALLAFKSDTRTIETAYTLTTVAIGPAMIALPKLIAFARRAGGVGAADAADGQDRPGPRDPRRRQGEAGRPADGHRRGPCLRHELRHRPGLPGRGGLLPAAGLLRQSAGGQRLRAGGLHHRRARRHGQLRRRAAGRPADRRGRVARRPVLRRVAGPDRHLRDLHRRAAVPAAGPVRGQRAHEGTWPRSRCSPRWWRARRSSPLRRRAQLHHDGAVRLPAGAGLEHPGRLRRPVLLRPRPVLRHRRLRAGHRPTAGASIPGWRCRWRWPPARAWACSSAR